MDYVFFARKSFCDLKCVIAYSAGLWRILPSYNVPDHHETINVIRLLDLHKPISNSLQETPPNVTALLQIAGGNAREMPDSVLNLSDTNSEANTLGATSLRPRA